MSEQYHAITWTLQSYSTVRGEATCSAPEGSGCRLAGGPDCNCEEWDDVRRDERGQPYHVVDDEYDADSSTIRHYMHDQGECNVVLFLNASDIESCGPPHDVLIGVFPIKPVWDGDGYLWETAS